MEICHQEACCLTKCNVPLIRVLNRSVPRHIEREFATLHSIGRSSWQIHRQVKMACLNISTSSMTDDADNARRQKLFRIRKISCGKEISNRKLAATSTLQSPPVYCRMSLFAKPCQLLRDGFLQSIGLGLLQPKVHF